MSAHRASSAGRKDEPRSGSSEGGAFLAVGEHDGRVCSGGAERSIAEARREAAPLGAGIASLRWTHSQATVGRYMPWRPKEPSPTCAASREPT
jgi:hypothetical protein